MPGSISTLTTEPAAVLAAQHSVIRWNGVLPGVSPVGIPSGKTLHMHFAIYAEQSRGLALWSETQSVKIDADGRYSVLLGANSAEGLPASLFPAGESRWVEAQPVGAIAASIGGEAMETPRSLLAAVPYAFKSVDAETLAGRAASDYVTRDDLRSSAIAGPMVGIPSTGLTAQPAISGTGTTNYLPIWTNSTTFGNSLLYQNGSFIGIGTTAPAATLDVNGSLTIRGQAFLPAGGTATASAGQSSHSLQLAATSYSSSSGSSVTSNFKLVAVPTGNNTTNPSALLSVFYGAGANTPAATGLSIATSGKINFAAGQTFPGTGTITQISASSPLTGGGTSGAVTLGLSTSALESTLNSVYPRLTAANTYTGMNTFNGLIRGQSTSTPYAIQGITSTGFGVQGEATGTGGYGVNGYTTGNGGIAVYGHSTGGLNGSNAPVGVQGSVTNGFGVEGITATSTSNYASVFGLNGGGSATLSYIRGFNDVSAGAWGDSAASSSTSFPIGVIGTADNSYAGYFLNNGSASTVYAENKGSGPTGLFKTLMAITSDGACGIGGAGNLTCTGQVKSLVSTGEGTRKVEAYAMQSPENWMEDFGSGKLSSGRAVVTIDPAFAETVSNNAEYHVFLTAKGESKNLYVTNETANSFEVHEASGGSASIGFDYRIVGKRRGFEAQRLTDVTESFQAEMKSRPAHIGSADAANVKLRIPPFTPVDRNKATATTQPIRREK